MTQTWRPCPSGYALYCAMVDEDAENPDALFTLAYRPKWWAWVQHRDNCTDCKLKGKAK